MSWKNVNLIFRREVRDQFRDRRTLFMVAVLPLLLYPALGIGMVQMMVLFSEQPRTVVILGAEDLPDDPQLQLLDGNRFDAEYFPTSADAEKLHLVTDTAVETGGAEDPRIEQIVSSEEHIRELIARQEALLAARAEWEQRQLERLKSREIDKPQPFPQAHELSDVKGLLSNLTQGAQVVIVIPKDFGKHILELDEQIAQREVTREDIADYERPKILHNNADEKSLVAFNHVQDVLESWEARILEQRLRKADLPQDLTEPVNPVKLDLAEDRQLSAFVWSKMFPALLVIMAVTGAFYPAIDLAAGEKERGTMETLLICPASRTEIVLGKFFTILLFSVLMALLNLVSMGLTSKYLASVANSGTFAKIGSLQPPSLAAIAWILVLLVPLAGLFSALCLSLATFARSTKEGQYYLTPLLMVTLGLTIFCLSPGIEIAPFYSVMPVVGIALLLKEVLADPLSPAALYYALPVLGTSVGYSLLALWWAIEQFSREDVLFREAERFGIRLWFHHLLRDKEATPSFAEAGYCFGLIMLLQFLSMKFMQQAISSAGPGQVAETMMQLLMVQQLAIIASPALFMGIMLTTNFRRTFRIRLPQGSVLAVALLLPFFLHPVAIELGTVLQKYFFLPLPPNVARQVQTMADLDQPLALVLLTFAVAPAICEEIAYRGFILSGFQRSGRTGLAIGLSAAMFGLMHMIPQQVFNAALLGVVLGLIAVRSGSLLPCIGFHFLWNSLAVLHSRAGHLSAAERINEHPVLQWFLSFNAASHQIHYRWPLLLIAGAAGAWLLTWLSRQPNRPTAAASTAEMREHRPASADTTLPSGSQTVGVP